MQAVFVGLKRGNHGFGMLHKLLLCYNIDGWKSEVWRLTLKPCNLYFTPLPDICWGIIPACCYTLLFLFFVRSASQTISFHKCGNKPVCVPPRVKAKKQLACWMSRPVILGTVIAQWLTGWFKRMTASLFHFATMHRNRCFMSYVTVGVRWSASKLSSTCC